MDLFQQVLAISGLLAIFLLHKQWKSRPHSPNSTKKSAPEPAGAWPILGHLHLLSGNDALHHRFAELADKHGPVFGIRFGMKLAVVVSNWEAVKECFTTNDKVLADRPSSSSGIYLGYNYAALGFAPYGPFWREMRKLVLLEVLSSRRLEMLKHVRISEIGTSIKELFSLINTGDSSNGLGGPTKLVVISEWIEQLTLNVIVRTIAGRRYTDTDKDHENKSDVQHFRRVVKEFMYISGKFGLSDIFPLPLLRWLDPEGHIKSMKRVSKELDSVIKVWIDEHMEKRMRSKPSEDQDFIDVMLSAFENQSTFGHSLETLAKATIMNIILAGSDTTSVHLTWVLSLILSNNHVMKQAQEEIDNKVGKERWADESDIKNLVFLQAIVKEALRLYPPGPLSVPHQAIQDCEISGYFVPKGTRLYVNLWKLHRDPRIWSEPEKFKPERFLSGGQHAELDFSGHHFEFTPFGSGRRSCPGITFAMQVTHLVLARLLQGFEFSTPSNLPVDMTEGQGGITLPKANPLEVLVSPRFPNLSLYS